MHLCTAVDISFIHSKMHDSHRILSISNTYNFAMMASDSLLAKSCSNMYNVRSRLNTGVKCNCTGVSFWPRYKLPRENPGSKDMQPLTDTTQTPCATFQ